MRGLLAMAALWLEQVRGRRCTPRRILMAAAAGAALFMGVVLFAQGTRLIDHGSEPDDIRTGGHGPGVVRTVPSMCHRVQYFLQARPVAGAVNCRWRVVNGAHLDLAHCRVRLQRSLLGSHPVVVQDYNISQGESLPSGAFLDGHVYEGTTYVYEVVVADTNTGARRLVASATAVTLDNHLPPRRARAEYVNDKYGGRQPQYLSFTPRSDLLVDTYVLHGVQVRVAFEKALISYSSTSDSGSTTGSGSGTRGGRRQAGFLRGGGAASDDDDDSSRNTGDGSGARATVSKRDAGVFALREAVTFHRLRVMFGSFPVSEYRIAVHSNGSLTSENELGASGGGTARPLLTHAPSRDHCSLGLAAGLVYPPSEVSHLLGGWGEKQAHEIAHAWIGGQLRFGATRAGGGSGSGSATRDDARSDPDVWAREGLTHLYGVLALDVATAHTFFQVRYACRSGCRATCAVARRLTPLVSRRSMMLVSTSRQ